jgi:site-specific DNA recombinase
MRYKAVALCRVSTSKQRIEGSSLEAQEKRIIDAANLLDVELSPDNIWRVDVSSRKGKNLQRADLKQIRELCRRDKRIKYLIVDEPDRFMRSIKEYYWWKVEFETLGVELRFADKPLASDSDQHHVFDELIDVYRAESSNQERSTKSRDKMQAKIDLGYYPGNCRIGYKKSDAPGMHIPDQPRFNLLQQSMKQIASGKHNLKEALKWLEDEGFTLHQGKKLDMHRLKEVLQEPYYCGIVKMGEFKSNEQGLHEPMVSKEEFEVISRVAKGVKAKFKVNRNNPKFPMNGLVCTECLKNNVSNGKFTGFKHHNGKPGSTRKYYDRYHCRGCRKAFTREALHSAIETFLQSVQINETARGELMQALRRAWSEVEQDNLQSIKRLATKIQLAEEQKGRLIVLLANSPDLSDDIENQIRQTKQDILNMENELDEAQNIEKDFVEFVKFSLGFVNNMKAKWWELEHDDRRRCEQLIFPQYLHVDKRSKVSTPEISPLFRYKNKEKEPRRVLISANGGPSGIRTQDTGIKSPLL